MSTVRRQGGIIQIHDYNRITRLTENVSKTKYCKILFNTSEPLAWAALFFVINN